MFEIDSLITEFIFSGNKNFFSLSNTPEKNQKIKFN